VLEERKRHPTSAQKTKVEQERRTSRLGHDLLRRVEQPNGSSRSEGRKCIRPSDERLDLGPVWCGQAGCDLLKVESVRREERVDEGREDLGVDVRLADLGRVDRGDERVEGGPWQRSRVDVCSRPERLEKSVDSSDG
jgi:hypothetical protein